LACIPLITYGVPIKEIIDTVNKGYSILKIKIGQPGTEQEMLEKDKRRILNIHQAIGHFERENTQNGKIAYYIDANGRYQQKETLLKLLEFMNKIGAYDQILILEEPFSEHYETSVDDLGVWVAADESLQSVEDARHRIQMGYSAFALKPIAKTLSETFRIGELAHLNNIPCFCADLTVPPVLVEWNKSVAARLAPFPGWEMGFLESNGFQNYKNWIRLKSYLPFPKASWVEPQNGIYFLNEDYYQKDGGIFESSKKLLNLFA
jgi:L-alanine-DL-glutamate epimerase-like enolase superfamily enzyme